MREPEVIKNEIDIKIEEHKLIVEDFGGRRRFLIEMEPIELYKHERMFLSNNICDGFLPMNFLKQETIDKVFYDFTGLLQLKSYLKFIIEKQQRRRLVSEEDMQTALYIVDQVLKIIRDAEDCMLFIQRFMLTRDYIFINPHTLEVKIAYVPDNSTMSTQIKLISFIEGLKSVFQDITVVNTLNNLKSAIIKENHGIEQLRNIIGKTQRDLKITYSLD